MNFWENVCDELEFKGINRKTLAQKAEFDVSNIGKGIKNGNIPAADTALKIANELGVPLEYLLNMESKTSQENNTKLIGEEIALFRKYRKLVQNMEKLSDKEKSAVEKLAENLGE